MKLNNALTISKFWRNVGKLASGTVLAQIIGITLTPVITRIFDAHDIGILNIFNQIIGLLVVVSVFRLDRAVVLSTREDASQILRAGIQLIVGFTLLLTLITMPFADFWFRFFGLEYPRIFILALPAAFFLQSLVNFLKAGGNSFSLYSVMALTIVLQSLLVHVLKIVFGIYLGAGPAWLILAELVSGVAGAALLLYSLKKSAGFVPRFLSMDKLRQLLKSQKKFYRYDVPAALLNFASWSVATFLLAWYFDTRTVGHYALGFMMLRLPMNLLGKAIGDVFYKDSADQAGNKEQLLASSSRVVIMLFTFGILPIAAVFFFGDVLFSFFFGKEWIRAGEFSQILSIWTLIWFVSSPISNLYYVLNVHHRFLTFMASSLVVRGLAISVGAMFFEAEGTLVLYSIASLIMYAYQVYFLLGKLDVRWGEFFRKLWLSSRFTLIPIAVMLLLDAVSPATPIVIAILVPLIGGALAWRWFRKSTIRI